MARPEAAGQLKMTTFIGVLGVICGDIGTSPLYVLQASLAYVSKAGIRAGDVLGLLSLMFWALIVTVMLKYATFVMRADNGGEGGILALMALATGAVRTQRARAAVILTGVVGAGLFLGDGLIRPAISILSAVEGRASPRPTSRGSSCRSRSGSSSGCSPCSAAARVPLASCSGRSWWYGLSCSRPSACAGSCAIRACCPPSIRCRGAAFILRHGPLAFVALGAIVLTVTGAEALYADMSHFGRRPIRLFWL